jgi:hypothetical protein
MPLINYIGNRLESLTDTKGRRGNAAPPPPLNVEYLVVGGGTSGRGGDGTYGIGGSGGGVISGSLAIPFTSTTSIIVGLGGISGSAAGSSSIVSPTLGTFTAGGANASNSGLPQANSEGLSGPGLSQGGGAGSSQNGLDGVTGQSGNGGSGSLWLDGNWYAGGGGGVGGGAAGGPGIGGGGTALTPGIGPDGLPYQLNGYNGRGGGGAGTSGAGGSGIVIIRYSTSSVVPPYDNAIDGGSISISGGYIYRTFTGSAQLVYSF